VATAHHHLQQQRISHSGLVPSFAVAGQSIFSLVYLRFFFRYESIRALSWKCVYCALLKNGVFICVYNPQLFNFNFMYLFYFILFLFCFLFVYILLFVLFCFVLFCFVLFSINVMHVLQLACGADVSTFRLVLWEN
jgi:hypothetical protein